MSIWTRLNEIVPLLVVALLLVDRVSVHPALEKFAVELNVHRPVVTDVRRPVWSMKLDHLFEIARHEFLRELQIPRWQRCPRITVDETNPDDQTPRLVQQKFSHALVHEDVELLQERVDHVDPESSVIPRLPVNGIVVQIRNLAINVRGQVIGEPWKENNKNVLQVGASE